MDLTDGEYYWIGGAGDFGAASSYDIAIYNEYGTLILWPANEDYIVPSPSDLSVLETLYVATAPNADSFVDVENGGTITGAGTAYFLYLDSSLLINASTDAAEIDIGINASGSVSVAGGNWVCAGGILDIGKAYSGTLSITLGGNVTVGKANSFGIVSIGDESVVGTVTVENGILSASEYIDIYDGTLTIANGGSVSAPYGIDLSPDITENFPALVVLNGGTVTGTYTALVLETTHDLEGVMHSA